MKKIFLLVVALSLRVFTWSYDFSAVVSSGQTLYFTITDSEKSICYVDSVQNDTYQSTIAGDIEIPATIVNPNNDMTYTVKGILGRAFTNCTKITGVTFPTATTFTSIGTETQLLGKAKGFSFYNAGIKTLTIPDNVTELGEQGFRETKVENVTIGSGITKIPDDLFFDCKQLKRIVFPDNVQEFGSEVFGSCSALKYVELGNNVTKINASAFGGNYASAIDTIVMNTTTPPTVDGDFNNNLAARAILYVPETAVDAYKSATKWKQFKYIYAIGQSVPFDTVTVKYENQARIYGALVYIDNTTIFSDRTSSVVHDDSIEIKITIANRFYGIDKVLLDTEDITDKFVNNTAKLKITQNCTLKVTFSQKKTPYDFSKAISSGQTLYFKITSEGNKKAKIVNKTGGRSIAGIVSYAYGIADEEPQGQLVIPTKITHNNVEYTIDEIDTLAFSFCEQLTSIVIPEGIKTIRQNAFMADDGIDSLIVPQSCTTVEGWAFRDCRLSYIDLGGATSMEQYVILNNDLVSFKTGPNVKNIYQSGLQIAPTTTKEIELGENVEWLSQSAFYSMSSLTSVTCLSATPPAVGPSRGSNSGTSWSNWNPANCTLYVLSSPNHTILEAYKATNCWKLFDTVMELPIITWKNYDGTVLEIDSNVARGTMPSYNGDIPTRTSTHDYHYTFKAWSPTIDTVKDALTYIADFDSTARTWYTVNFIDWDSTELKSEEVEAGNDATAPTTPTHDHRTFMDWDQDFTNVQSDLTVMAIYNIETFTVLWKNYDGSVLETDSNVAYGTMPTYDGEIPVRQADDEMTYSFKGWTPTLDTITGDATYTATFDGTPKEKTGIVSVKTDQKAIKRLEEGQLRIYRKGQAYSSDGKRMK